jgi:hypothetical protein
MVETVAEFLCRRAKRRRARDKMNSRSKNKSFRIYQQLNRRKKLKLADVFCSDIDHSNQSSCQPTLDLLKEFYSRLGRAVAQAVSRRLPTAAARVRSQVRSCGICDGQSGTGADFLLVPRFHQLLHTHHNLSSGAGAIDQLLADVASRLSLTPP